MTDKEKVEQWFKTELSMCIEESLDAMECEDIMHICLKVFKELEQYKAIGTVEDIQKVLSFLGDENKRSIIDDLKLLNDYKDAEEEGLLVKLPCKVGDTVYEISLVEPYRNPAIREMGVVDILLRDDDMYFTLQDLHDEYYDNSILSTEIGKTVFLTQEEAGQTLAKMKAGEMNE